MKNIHVLPTDNPSNLFEIDGHLIINKKQLIQPKYYRNIYITSDEEIKDVRLHKGKWHLEKENILNKFPDYLTDLSECKLIIMTTDQDLIKDGVQAIDNEFLEWFVKNSSCEYVKIENIYDKFLNGDKRSVSDFRNKYKIIIPKEEPKQETLEEASETKLYQTINKIIDGGKDLQKGYNVTRGQAVDYAFEIALKVAKWQAERMYSEEEVIDLLQKMNDCPTTFEGRIDIKEWFNQFKKK